SAPAPSWLSRTSSSRTRWRSACTGRPTSPAIECARSASSSAPARASACRSPDPPRTTETRLSSPNRRRPAMAQDAAEEALAHAHITSLLAKYYQAIDNGMWSVLDEEVLADDAVWDVTQT